MFLDEDEFSDANSHIEKAKSHGLNNPYLTGRAMEVQARVWYRENRFEDAISETLLAIEFHEKLGLVQDVRNCKDLLQRIEQATKIGCARADSDPSGKLLENIKSLIPVHISFPAGATS